jgi:hypothetical protein
MKKKVVLKRRKEERTGKNHCKKAKEASKIMYKKWEVWSL